MNMNFADLTVKKFNAMRGQGGLQTLNALRNMSHDPMAVNEALLMEILRDCKDTEYGRKYNFADIHSIEDYQRMVPVSTYQDYEDYIQRTIHNNEENLLTAYPFELFCQSSGTLGKPKILPMSNRAIEIQTKWNSPAVFGVLEEALGDSWQDGRWLMCMSCSLTEMKHGKRFGALSSILMKSMIPIIHLATSTPVESFFPTAPVDARYLQARFGLMDRDIRVLSGTFHCYVVETLRYIEHNWQMLVDDIEHGTISRSVVMADEVRTALEEKLTPMPERAAELRAIFEKGFDTPFASQVWPFLKVVSGVGTGSFEKYADMTKSRYVNDDVSFFYAGISSTEALFSTPLSIDSKDSALVPPSVFYEFLPIEAGDDFSKIVTMDQLEEGKDYEIIMTNLSGLYRYRMRDCIRVTGFLNKLPLIRFQYRIEQTLDIMGDHTTEETITLFAGQTARELGFSLVDFAVYPDKDSDPVKYVYYMEVDNLPENITEQEIQQSLWHKFRNGVYFLTDKMDTGRATIEVHLVRPNTFSDYKKIFIEKGANAEQVKPLSVVSSDFQKNYLLDHVLPARLSAVILDPIVPYLSCQIPLSA